MQRSNSWYLWTIENSRQTLNCTTRIRKKGPWKRGIGTFPSKATQTLGIGFFCHFVDGYPAFFILIRANFPSEQLFGDHFLYYFKHIVSFFDWRSQDNCNRLESMAELKKCQSLA
jgi:hypothetical protein